MKLKRSQVYNVYGLINSLKGKHNKHFQMYLFDVLNALDPTFKSIREVLKPSDKFLEYETRRNELLKMNAEVDENGRPKTYIDPFTNAESYSIPKENFDKVKIEIEKLKNEYADVIVENMKQQPEIQKVMEDEVDIPHVPLIPFTLVPEEIDIDVLRGLRPFIDRGDK